MSIDQWLLRVLYVCLIVLAILSIIGFSLSLVQRVSGQ